MIAASPHLYRSNAPSGLPPEVIERAISQSAKPEALGLPAVLTLGHLCHLTGADYQYLRSIVLRKRDGYHSFTIRKRSGGARLIASPEPILAAVQRWLVAEILNKRPVHPASHAYKPGSSPILCARRHVGAAWLIKIDIHDFFESISEKRAYFVFRGCGYQPLISFEMARLCTRVITGTPNVGRQWSISRHDKPTVYPINPLGHLPQGAPSSPMLSNLVSFELDKLLQKLAAEHSLTFTRYSDDLAFSGGKNVTHSDAQNVIVNVERILQSFGHEVHRRKTTIAPPGARKVVLGLLVDGDRVRLTKELRAKVSDHVRGVEKFGLAMHATDRHFASIWGMVRHINGLISHVQAVDNEFARGLRARLDRALEAERWGEI